jgi:cytochrome c1
MTHRLAVALAATLALGYGIAAASAQEALEPKHESWSFHGPFGTFDQAQLQRGFQVYKEVCSACHSLNLVTFRSLGEPGALGYTDDQIRALAAGYKIRDGEDATGQPVTRPGRPSDHFPPPFANEAAARAALNGALPPDLSLIVKARTFEEGFPTFLADPFTQYNEKGQDYVYSILTDFGQTPPKSEGKHPGLYYNPYFPGHWIAMPPPLTDGRVQYSDGSPQTVDQYAKDVVAFLTWAAEPHLMARKRIGFQVVVFLIALAVLLWFTKHRIWARDPNRGLPGTTDSPAPHA